MDRKDILSVLVLIGIIAFVVLIYALPDLIMSLSRHEYPNATVIDKYIKRYNDQDYFFIVIKTEDGKKVVLMDRDTIVFGKFNSADIYASVEIGKKYTFYTYGWRVPLFSWFENIYKVVPLNSTS